MRPEALAAEEVTVPPALMRRNAASASSRCWPPSGCAVAAALPGASLAPPRCSSSCRMRMGLEVKSGSTPPAAAAAAPAAASASAAARVREAAAPPLPPPWPLAALCAAKASARSTPRRPGKCALALALPSAAAAEPAPPNPPPLFPVSLRFCWRRTSRRRYTMPHTATAIPATRAASPTNRGTRLVSVMTSVCVCLTSNVALTTRTPAAVSSLLAVDRAPKVAPKAPPTPAVEPPAPPLLLVPLPVKARPAAAARLSEKLSIAACERDVANKARSAASTADASRTRLLLTRTAKPTARCGLASATALASGSASVRDSSSRPVMVRCCDLWVVDPLAVLARTSRRRSATSASPSGCAGT